MIEYLIIVIFLWVLLGLSQVAPYISGGIARRSWIVILFIILGPLIAITSVINVILMYISGEDDDTG